VALGREGAERTNLEVVRLICAHFCESNPRPAGSYAELILFMAGRTRHDLPSAG